MEQMLCQQITRGYNIVADGWAGASNPHTHNHLEYSFFHFSTRLPRTDGWTDKPMENLLYSCLPASKNGPKMAKWAQNAQLGPRMVV